MANNKYIFAWRDFDNDRQEVSYPVNDTAVVADWSGFAVHLDNWLCGASAGGGFYDDQAPDLKVAATTPIAQSASQAIMEVIDTVNGNAYRYRLPFPNLAKAVDGTGKPPFVVSGGLTIFNPDHADYAPFKADIESDLESPVGNPITLARIYIEE